MQQPSMSAHQPQLETAPREDVLRSTGEGIAPDSSTPVGETNLRPGRREKVNAGTSPEDLRFVSPQRFLAMSLPATSLAQRRLVFFHACVFCGLNWCS